MQKDRSPGKRPTSYDVANHAGVSQATVSLVLSGKGSALGISSDTEKKVLEAVQALSYYPNTLIRSIQLRRTGIIGLYARDHKWGVSNIYWSEVMASLHAAVAASEQELLIFSDVPTRPMQKLLERMLGGIVDGLIVQPGDDTELLAALIRSKIPLVCIGDYEDPIARICLDNRDATEKLVNHLVEREYRSIAMLNWHISHAGAAFQREEAFLRTSNQAGVSAGQPVFRLRSDFRQALQEISDFRPKIDALICFNDEMAYGVVKHALEMGLRVPQDLAVVGYDGLPNAVAWQQLTTVKSPIAAMCDTALSHLKQIIGGEEITTCTRMTGELLIGRTS